jgi:stage V sporulation protein G
MAQNKKKNEQTHSTPKIEARIDRILTGEGKTKAFASATIGGAFAIHGIRIIDKLDSEKGFFIAMPQASYNKDGEKKYKDTFHAVTAEARTALIEAVDTAYAQKLEEVEEQGQQEETEEAPELGMGMSM